MGSLRARNRKGPPVIRYLFPELSNALWTTRHAARKAVIEFFDRWAYLWPQRKSRDTIDEVESWYDDPARSP